MHGKHQGIQGAVRRDSGGGEAGVTDTLSTQRVPLCTVLRYPLLPDGHLIFSEGALGVNIY